MSDATDIYEGQILTLNEYQRLAARTAIYEGRGTALGLNYVALKLNGEAGELAEFVGKAMRDDQLFKKVTIDGDTYFLPQKLTYDKITKIRKEIGDCLWYLSQMCFEISVQFGAPITLGDVAHENILKLQSRKERGVLGGSGNNR